MAKFTRSDLYFWLSSSLALCFCVFGSIWTYLANLVLAPPMWLASFMLWRLGKATDPDAARYRWPPRLWGAGLALSLTALIVLLIFN